MEKVNGNPKETHFFKKTVKNSKIFSASELANEGKKVARLKGNRDLNEKAINAKKKSMKQFGQLVPAIMVDATTAIEQGLEVVDFVTGEEINEQNAPSYIVLLDANHRYQAHLKLLEENLNLKEEEPYTQEFYLAYSLNEEVSIDKALAEINIATTPWKGADYVKGVKMMVEAELPVLDFISELTAEGFSLDAASKVALFNGKVNKTVLVKAINGTVDDCLKTDAGLERGKKILDAAKASFSSDFLKNRTWIDWVISKYEKTTDEEKGHFTDSMVKFLSGIKREDAEPLEKAKGKRGGKTKETLINEGLNALWDGNGRRQAAPVR
jgi:hypothetical protein